MSEMIGSNDRRKSPIIRRAMIGAEMSNTGALMPNTGSLD